MSVTNEEQVGLPPLSAARLPTWERFRIEFLADGYPGRREDGVVHPHPVYGPYVVNDYVTQYRQTRDRTFLEAATRVADAAIDRMEVRADALVFWYKPHTGVSALPQEFFSGATQCRYLAMLGRLEALVGDGRFSEAGESVLASLLLPVDQGGVARRTPSGGLVVEECSGALPDLDLSGWTGATLQVAEYAEATGSEHAGQVFRDSVKGLVDVLPLYDVAELATSRPRLGGRARLRLSLQHPGARILDAWVDLPGQGRSPVGHEGHRRWVDLWRAGVGADGRLELTTAAADVTLCRVGWPEPPRLHLEVDVAETTRFALKTASGSYDPLTTVMPVEGWTVVERSELPPGRSSVEIAIPWYLTELVAYPTSFGPSVDRTRHNTRHFAHVDALRRLHQAAPEPAFDYYAHRWASYPERWPSMPEYQADISLGRRAA